MKNLSRVVVFILVGMFSANFIFATEKIDINTASLEDLIKIIHINEKRALELISLRPFSSLDELTKIKGIGKKRLEDIKKQGLAWVDPKLKPPEDEKAESLNKTDSFNKELAAVAEPFEKEDLVRGIPKFLSLFLVALSTAIFSAIIILILKIKLKKLYNKNV